MQPPCDICERSDCSTGSPRAPARVSNISPIPPPPHSIPIDPPRPPQTRAASKEFQFRMTTPREWPVADGFIERVHQDSFLSALPYRVRASDKALTSLARDFQSKLKCRSHPHTTTRWCYL